MTGQVATGAGWGGDGHKERMESPGRTGCTVLPSGARWRGEGCLELGLGAFPAGQTIHGSFHLLDLEQTLLSLSLSFLIWEVGVMAFTGCCGGLSEITNIKSSVEPGTSDCVPLLQLDLWENLCHPSCHPSEPFTCMSV